MKKQIKPYEFLVNQKNFVQSLYHFNDPVTIHRFDDDKEYHAATIIAAVDKNILSVENFYCRVRASGLKVKVNHLELSKREAVQLRDYINQWLDGHLEM